MKAILTAVITIGLSVIAAAWGYGVLREPVTSGAPILIDDVLYKCKPAKVIEQDS